MSAMTVQQLEEYCNKGDIQQVKNCYITLKSDLLTEINSVIATMSGGTNSTINVVVKSLFRAGTFPVYVKEFFKSYTGVALNVNNKDLFGIKSLDQWQRVFKETEHYAVVSLAFLKYFYPEKLKKIGIDNPLVLNSLIASKDETKLTQMVLGLLLISPSTTISGLLTRRGVGVCCGFKRNDNLCVEAQRKIVKWMPILLERKNAVNLLAQTVYQVNQLIEAITVGEASAYADGLTVKQAQLRAQNYLEVRIETMKVENAKADALLKAKQNEAAFKENIRSVLLISSIVVGGLLLVGLGVVVYKKSVVK